MAKDVIVALDFDSKEKALAFLDNFNEEIYVKVGMELFYKEGPEIIKEIKKRGHKIFLDLKLHDIPNTVESATKSLMNLDVDMINYHIAGGEEMLSRSTKSAKELNKNIITLGITMLTSTSEEMMHEDILIKDNLNIEDTVLSYAKDRKSVV